MRPRARRLMTLLLTAIGTLAAVSVEARTVRVGIYPGPPVSALGPDGQPEGIYVDLLEEVGRRQGWSLEYLHGTWVEGLERLAAAEIDLMVGIGFSEERAERFDFTEEPVLSNWGQVYVHRGSDAQSILDLDGRRIAVLREDIYYAGLRERMQRFGLKGYFLEVDTRDEILALVASGGAEAGMISRLTGKGQLARYDIQASSIVCCPVELRLAAPRGQSPDLLAAVDAYLREARDDRRSAFHRSVDRWLDPPSPVEVLPTWLLTLLLGILVVAAGGVAGVLVFRQQLRVKTAELAGREAQLRHAQRLEALGRLAAGVAHDFNNQLTVIQGVTELLGQTEELGDRGRELLVQLSRASSDAAALTDSLLAFGRRQRLAPRTFALGPLVLEQARSLNRLIGDEITLAVEVEPGAGTRLVHADPVQLRQVLVNLAVNARDALPDGGHIDVTVEQVILEAPPLEHPEVSPGAHVVLTVRDDGVGIAPELHAQVFEPFFTTKPGGAGTGLGLAMVHGFAAQSDGFVTVTSAPGEGAAFALHLPEVDGPAEPLPSPSSRPVQMHTPVTARPAGSPDAWTILVVEDEAAVRLLFVTILKHAGYDVISAPDPHAALALAEEHDARLGLLLTDVMMPDIRGTEVASRIRARRPELPVLFVTGHSDVPLEVPGTGPIDVLQKPVQSERLLATIEQLLG